MGWGWAVATVAGGVRWRGCKTGVGTEASVGLRQRGTVGQGCGPKTGGGWGAGVGAQWGRKVINIPYFGCGGTTIARLHMYRDSSNKYPQ